MRRNSFEVANLSEPHRSSCESEGCLQVVLPKGVYSYAETSLPELIDREICDVEWNYAVDCNFL